MNALFSIGSFNLAQWSIKQISLRIANALLHNVVGLVSIRLQYTSITCSPSNLHTIVRATENHRMQTYLHVFFFIPTEANS